MDGTAIVKDEFVGTCANCKTDVVLRDPDSRARCIFPQCRVCNAEATVTCRRTPRPVVESDLGAVWAGSEWILIDATPFEFAPRSIPALSKSGRDWFAAAARNARRTRHDVPQNLGDLARALKAAPSDADGSWFAFGGDGKVVLSLRTSREAALEIAVAYNKAGGDLVLLAPSRDLRAVPTELCVAVPSDAPPAPQAPKADLLDTVRYAWVVYEDSKVKVHDTTLGALVTAVWGAVVDPSRASATDVDPELVDDIRDLLGRPAVWSGTWKRLPKATFKDGRDGTAVVQVLPLTDARAHRSRFDRGLLAPLLADLTGAATVELFEAHGAAYLSLRVRRPDGIVCLLAGRES